MTLFSASEIADLRGVANSAHPTKGSIQRQAQVSDGQGGWITTWATIATDVACRRKPAEGQVLERVVGDKLTPLRQFVITMPAGTDVRHGDRILLPDPRSNLVVDDVAVTAYHVIGEMDTDEWETDRRMRVEIRQ